MLVIQVLCMLQSSSYRVLQKRWLGTQSTCDVDYPTIRKTCAKISQKNFICLCGIRKVLLHTYAELVIMQFSTWLWDLMDFRWMEYWWRKFSKMCLSSRRLNVSLRYANSFLRSAMVFYWHSTSQLYERIPPPSSLFCTNFLPRWVWADDGPRIFSNLHKLHH